jgi:hypothetical protein
VNSIFDFNKGLIFHINSNTYIDVDSCTFIRNEAYSRGVVAFAEGDIAMIAFLNSVFI